MPVTGPEAELVRALEGVFGAQLPARLGVAVSGGGDSMALLDLLHQWGQVPLYVVSVNHGLRKEAAQEVALVADYAARHDLPHDVLDWRWDGVGNLQQAARDGRREMIAAWAAARHISYVALGHTEDDQAETFLMRLARGSGVDGLAAMAQMRQEEGLTWLRPLLTVGRASLRDHLRARNLAWADDPSNEDIRFDRVKARQMMHALAPLGLSVARLAQTAAHMRRERDVAAWAVATALEKCVTLDAGDVVIARDAAAELPEALFLRLVSDGLAKVSGQPYRPRFRALQAAVASSGVTSLHGCLLLPTRDHLRITREWAAIQNTRCAVSDLWDGRWRFTPPPRVGLHGLEIAALGETGIAQIAEWRNTGRPRQSVIAAPAVWRGTEVVSAPLAGAPRGWLAELC